MYNLIPFENSIARRLLAQATLNPTNIALKTDHTQYSYEALFNIAKNIAVFIQDSMDVQSIIMAGRNIAAYAGLLGSLLAGKTYVFLNCKDNESRIKQNFLQVSSSLVITDIAHFELAKSFLERKENYAVICVLVEKGGKLRFFSKNNSNQMKEHCLSVSEYQAPNVASNIAYLMFTSGSTGLPKKVPITHANLYAFLDNMIARIKPTNSDVFSHINELTFDFSVYDIFVCWIVGACLCVLPDNYILGIPRYIEENKITYWACVPSLVNLLNQLKKIPINAFNSIRYTVFCGEALTTDIAKKWQQAAPNSVIDNLYGPTEATVAISGYIWKQYENTIIPIGHVFNDQGFYLLNDAGQIVEEGEPGEICLYGTQVMSGYWRDEVITAEQFITVFGKRVYKTGDLAVWNEKEGLIYKGRKDDQLKIRGYRVEKLEIENRIKLITETPFVAIVPIQDTVTGHTLSLSCFIAGTIKNKNELLLLCRQTLPDYMLPANIIKLDQLPYNKNGKVDYQQLNILAKNPDHQLQRMGESCYE
ncbi:MAG: AMP-binding protein [Legionellales bacterium]|nr:AMP-binding protein [Legionellales bacterium]